MESELVQVMGAGFLMSDHSNICVLLVYLLNLLGTWNFWSDFSKLVTRSLQSVSKVSSIRAVRESFHPWAGSREVCCLNRGCIEWSGIRIVHLCAYVLVYSWYLCGQYNLYIFLVTSEKTLLFFVTLVTCFIKLQ